jgi:hypothetical protein
MPLYEGVLAGHKNGHTRFGCWLKRAPSSGWRRFHSVGRSEGHASRLEGALGSGAWVSTVTAMNLDSQVVEVLGRSHLVAELLKAGLEVAEPVRDRGIDLIAYSDLDAQLAKFVACPIQMKASSTESFSLDAKYAAFPNLIIAHVWHVNSAETPVSYALTYPEALGVATHMGWTATASWANGYYTNTRPGVRLRGLLEPYHMSPAKWRAKVTGEILATAV